MSPPTLSSDIQRQIAELSDTRPYDGRRVTLRESRGGWRWTGIQGICLRLAADHHYMVLLVEHDPEGHWPAGMTILAELDHETIPQFHGTEEYALRLLRERVAELEAERERMLPIYTAHLERERSAAEARERECLRVATLTVHELHREQRHPDYEYRTTENARKQAGGEPPENEGWEPNDIVNCDLCENGVVVEERWCNWTRGDFTETNYWRRKRP